MLPKGLTLRGLEVFEALASTGSVAQTAERTGLSQPAVSQQLRNLESALGTHLIDHSRRPMRLTPAGIGFLDHASTALSALRRAHSELKVMDLAHLGSMSVGIIDDFDNDLTPRLATSLADSLAHSRFKMVSAPSHEILGAVEAQQLHLAISASAERPMEGCQEYPLVRDPFIAVVPAECAAPEGLGKRDDGLPFLRYDATQLISQQVGALLEAHGVVPDDRFEVGSHLALMAMVARRIGWTITTPLGFMRTVRFHDRITAYPLPDPASARTISLFCGADWGGAVPAGVAATMRGMIQTHIIDPATARMPWLGGSFYCIDAPD